MMKKITMSAAFTAVVMLSACAGPDQAARQAADYGAFPANYEEVIARYHEANMKDPESVRVKYLGGPKKAVYSGALVREPVYGYVVCMSVNAKNSYGAYTGNQLTGVFIRDGKVRQYTSATDDFTSGMVNKMCANAIGHFYREGEE
jgi:hypothetical protein